MAPEGRAQRFPFLFAHRIKRCVCVCPFLFLFLFLFFAGSLFKLKIYTTATNRFPLFLPSFGSIQFSSLSLLNFIFVPRSATKL